MKKAWYVIKIILSVLFFAFLALSIVFLIMLAYQDYTKSTNNNTFNIGDTIKNATAIFTCITASLSLYLASTNKRDSEKNRIINQENGIIQNWYNALIIERHLDNILTFFDDCSKLVDIFEEIDRTRGSISYSEYDNKCKEQVIRPFTTQYTELQSKLISDASVIDTSLSTSLCKEFTKFQDNFLEQIQVKTPDYNKMKTYIIESQKQVVKLIKDFNLRTMK